MTVLAFRSRGRHRKGVPALELIASARAVNAPVCGNCGSVNTNPHDHDAYGEYLICEDCGAQLDENGARL